MIHAKVSGRLTDEEWELVGPLARAWARAAPSSDPIRDRDTLPIPRELLARLSRAGSPADVHRCASCGRHVLEPDPE